MAKKNKGKPEEYRWSFERMKKDGEYRTGPGGAAWGMNRWKGSQLEEAEGYTNRV